MFEFNISYSNAPALAKKVSVASEATLADARIDQYKNTDLLGAGTLPEVDYGQQDYDLMQAIYNGEAQETGFQLGALFSNFVVNTIAGFVIGKMPTVIVRDRKSGKQEEDLTTQANDFLRREAAKIKKAYKGSLKLGDSYIVHGLDGKLAVIAPNQGEPGFELWNDDLNSFVHVVKKVLVDPKTREKGEVEIVVLYTNEQIIYEAKLEQGSKVSLNKFGKKKITLSHVLGECPVLLLANNKEEDSVFGWSEFAPLIPYMNMWHQVMLQGFAANKYNGNPILAITGIPTSVDQWLQSTVGTNSGASDAVIERALDTFLRRFKLLALGEGQDAKFVESKSPLGGTLDLLKVILNGLVNTSKIPAFMWGFEMSGNNATVREQSIALKAYIDNKRTELGESLRKLIGWNFILASNNPQDLSRNKGFKLPEVKVKVNSVDDLNKYDIILAWPPQLNSDEQQSLEVVKTLLENGALSYKTSWEILENYVHDGEKEIQRLIEQNQNEDLVPVVQKKAQDSAKEKNQDQRGRDDQGSSGDNSGKTSVGK